MISRRQPREQIRQNCVRFLVRRSEFGRGNGLESHRNTLRLLGDESEPVAAGSDTVSLSSDGPQKTKNPIALPFRDAEYPKALKGKSVVLEAEFLVSVEMEEVVPSQPRSDPVRRVTHTEQMTKPLPAPSIA
ncbi:hypothetical protein ACFWC5_40580 [Streptomyces sp. NPDC060085]|uniref:hypothetical protein n=1 Tax=Streptomyces sp. NPDC060085 TaxID=3347054 RepID=UPI00365C9CF5